ncbi:MAG TPA: exopolysaccharide biosynthesis protein [Stellaceae bacterium]|nr:exopolysaccharide biosynthesis protein [Stellaceae bacterium]
MSADAHLGRARISDALDGLRQSHTGPRVSLGDLLDALEDRGFGLIVLALALPNGIPGPTLPGFSALFGIPLILVGTQLLRGWHEPRIPQWLRRRSVTADGFSRFLDRALPRIRRVERWLRPRDSWLTGVGGGRLAGIGTILMGIVLSLPVPLGNLPIAWSLVVLALGLLEEDSRALLLGLVLGALSIAWNVLVVLGGAAIFARLEVYFR